MSTTGNARGLLYEPSYEEEVVMLFGLLIPHLKDDFVIDSFAGTFPDCYARRNGEKVGIEFELLANHFLEHGHEKDERLGECNFIVCWKNNAQYRTRKKDGSEFLKVNEREIEIMALDKIVDALEKERTLKFIVLGKRPGLEEASRNAFFDQLGRNTSTERREFIKRLYEWVISREEFEVRWGRGHRWFTMRVYAKQWNVDPVNITGDGAVSIGYQGNPALSPWELPQKTQKEVRRIFKHEMQKWPSAPLHGQTDFDNLRKALEVFAEHSKDSEIIWHLRQ